MVKKKKKAKEITKRIISGYASLGRGIIKLGKAGIKQYQYKQTPEYKKKLLEAYKLETKLAKAKAGLIKARRKTVKETQATGGNLSTAALRALGG